MDGASSVQVPFAMRSDRHIGVQSALFWVLCCGMIRDQAWHDAHLQDRVVGPVLIIHGAKDSVIDIGHSIELKNRCSSSYCKLITPESMDHNSFQIQDDIIAPIKNFFREVGIKPHRISNESTGNFQI